MKKYIATDEVINTDGNHIEIQKPFFVDDTEESSVNRPCWDLTAGNDPVCDCNPRPGHTFKVVGCKVNGIWFQSPNTWAQAPTFPGPFSQDPCPGNIYAWADWGPILFSDYNNPLNPPFPPWNPQSFGGTYFDFVWNTHATFHHINIGANIGNPWEDAFYQNIVNSLGSGSLTVGQKFSAQISAHPNSSPNTLPGIPCHFALINGVASIGDFTAAGINFVANSPNEDKITDFCFEYAGYQLAWTTWAGYFSGFSNSNCENFVEGPKFCYEIGDITDPNDPLISGGAGGMVFATPFTGLNQTPFYYEVALEDVATGTTPINTVTIDDVFPYSQLTSLQGEQQCGKEGFDIQTGNYVYKPWDPSGLGAEFGAYNTQLTQPTSTDFGTGHDNTQYILNQPALPTFATHDIAAYLCSNYILNGKKGWFLPSLMEFHLLATNLGPGTPFENDLDLSTDVSKLQNTYWTSSEVNGYITNPLFPSTLPEIIGGPDNDKSDPFSWGYTAVDPTPPYSAFTFTPGAHVFSRCNTLSVRPIRRFECIETPLLEDTVYNFVDMDIIDEDYDDQAYGNYYADYFTGPAHTGFVLPGCLGAGGGETELTNPNNASETAVVRFDATIGFNSYNPKLALTDTAGNEYNLSDFDDANNPDGYTFKIWAADKTYLGTWHYQNCEVILSNNTWPNQGTLIDKNIFNKPIITNNSNITWFNNKDFPDSVSVKFTNVTHLDGPHEIVCYGHYNQNYAAIGANYVQAQGISGNFAPPSLPTTLWDLIDPSLGSTQLVGYDNEYKEGAYVGNSASYCYILFSCQTQQNKTISLPDVFTGNNTVYQGKKVVCFKDIFEQVKDIPGQQILHPTTGGSLGIGKVNLGMNTGAPISNTTYGSLLSDSGDTLDKNFGDFYPKHNLFTWVADYDPDPISNLPIFNNFLDGFNSETCGGAITCDYLPGDIGPAGGIICAIPYQNVNDPANGIVGPVVPPLQGNFVLKNNTNFYYELSPVNLNYTNPFGTPQGLDMARWGSAISPVNGVDVEGLSAYSDYWTPEMNFYYTPVNFTNENIGEGYQATYDMIAVNNGGPNGTPGSFGGSGGTFAYNIMNAFEMCANYSLNGYDDWFLPTTYEMEFARNYTPAGTLYDSTGGFGGNGNIDFTTGFVGEKHYWTCNTFAGDNQPDGYATLGITKLWNPINYFTNQPTFEFDVPVFAFSVSLAPIDNNNGPDGYEWRTLARRTDNLNVRAMRKFECATAPIIQEEVEEETIIQTETEIQTEQEYTTQRTEPQNIIRRNERNNQQTY
tara:strand:- start:310 stop:4152 length:3843 start_codon:yes stop_codon:yes gene_type:complete